MGKFIRISTAVIWAFLNPVKAMIKLIHNDDLRAGGQDVNIDVEYENDLLNGLEHVADDIPEFRNALDYFKSTLRKFGGKDE